MNKPALCLRMLLFAKRHRRLQGLVMRLNRVINSIDLPTSAQIDPTVRFLHNGLGCVIHENAVVGARTVICQNVTIGGRGQSGCPYVGEDVFIGPGSAILGGVKIGNHARVGANAVVLSDVPDNCTAVGVPARIIESDPSHIV